MFVRQAARGEGVEPSFVVPKTTVLPLDDPRKEAEVAGFEPASLSVQSRAGLPIPPHLKGGWGQRREPLSPTGPTFAQAEPVYVC